MKTKIGTRQTQGLGHKKAICNECDTAVHIVLSRAYRPYSSASALW